jgi:hypothetical protein
MYRLIYKSRCNGTLNWESVTEILSKCRTNNERHNITGVLLATSSHFLQALEGRYEDVNDTFMRIVNDEQHSDIQLVSFTVIDARLFAGWGMRGIGVMNFNEEIAGQLMDKYGEEQGSVRFPREEWVALAMINDIRMLSDLPDWKR